MENQKLYLCDGKACKECYECCSHTTNYEHAINKGKEMDFDENGVEIAMTDKEFAKYLFNWLRFGGDDCCSKCTKCPPYELCSNIDEEKGCFTDLNVCYQGMKAYAEKRANKE